MTSNYNYSEVKAGCKVENYEMTRDYNYSEVKAGCKVENYLRDRPGIIIIVKYRLVVRQRITSTRSH